MTDWVRDNRRKEIVLRNTWLTLIAYLMPTVVVGGIVVLQGKTDVGFISFLKLYAYIVSFSLLIIIYVKFQKHFSLRKAHVCSTLIAINWFSCFAWWIPLLGEGRQVALFLSPLMTIFLYPYNSLLLVLAVNALVLMVYAVVTQYALTVLGQSGALSEDAHLIFSSVIVGLVVNQVGVQIEKKRTQLATAVREQRAMRKKLEVAFRQLEVLATTDELTGLMNRRKINEILEYEYRKIQRSCSVFSIGLLDLDYFKSINDNYGHICGDHVLVVVAEFLEKQCRVTDTIARWGGEEFLILLPDTDQNLAYEIFSRLIEKLGREAIHYGGKSFTVSASVGISEVCSASNLEDVLKIADDNLYKAKEQGRNQAVVNA